MKPRRSLDRLLAVITVAFGALCAGALLVDVMSDPFAPPELSSMAIAGAKSARG